MKWFVMGLIFIAMVLAFINIFIKIIGKDELSDEWVVFQYLLLVMLLTELLFATML